MYQSIATVASSAPLAFYTDPSMSEKFRLKDEKHNVVLLFNPPKKPFIPSLRELIYRTFIHLGIQGRVFWVFEKKIGIYSEIDLKGNLIPILTHGNCGKLIRWNESNLMGTFTWTPEQVLPIIYYNPRDLFTTDVPITGLSPLQAARQSLDQEFNINAWNTSFFKSGMKTPLLLKSKGTLSKEQKAELRKEIINYYSGIDGGHGALIVSGSVEVTPLTISQKDIDFIEGKKFNREEICSLFGVPPALVGIFEYANFCVTGDTLISLPNGKTKQIIDLNVGDEILSMGENSIEVRKITNCFENGVKEIYQIKTGARTLKCSANHKFYKLNAGINPTYPREKVWEKAEDLKVGDYIATVSNIPEFDGEINLPDGILATDEIMHQFGLFTGDGCLDVNQGISIAIPDTDEDKNDYIENARNFFKTTRNFADGRKVHITRTKYTYLINSCAAARLLVSFGLNGKSRTKRIPEWIFGLTRPLKQAYLMGIFDSDGHYDKKGRIQVGLANKDLVNDIRDLCISVGWHVNNVRSKIGISNFGRCECHSIVVSFDGSQSVNFKNHPLPDGLMWQKVRSISLLDPEPTFDLEIEGTHNYFANWMVTHNSNTREQRKIFWENTLLPKMAMILELVQINILNRYFPGIYAKWDTSNIYGLKPDAADVANAAKVFYDMGVGVKDLATILKLPELANVKLEDRTPKLPNILNRPGPGGNNNKPIPQANRRPKPGKPIDNPGDPSNVQNQPKKELEIFFTDVLKKFTSSVILMKQRSPELDKKRWSEEFISIVHSKLEKFCEQNGYPIKNALEKSNDFVTLLLDGKLSLKSVNEEPCRFAEVLVLSIAEKTLKEFKIN